LVVNHKGEKQQWEKSRWQRAQYMFLAESQIGSSLLLFG
jgi:hypothetical protein